jgi:hypothetical protein
MTALDVWFEGPPRSGVVAADPSARRCGDLADAEAGAAPRCLTWGPASAQADIDAFAVASPTWHGLVRVVMADWRGASPLAPWVAADLAAVLADTRRALLVDPRGSEMRILDEVHALSAAFPMLPIVLGLSSAIDRVLAARLARACPSLLLASQRAETPALCDLAEVGKLVHGSGAQSASPAAADSPDLPPRVATTAEQLLAGEWRF